MSSSNISSLNFILQQIYIYLGTTILAAGVLGGILNTLVFLSLRTFRQSSCAFYLTVMSVVNIGLLFTGLLSRIMISGFAIDWTQTSLIYCKLRSYLLQVCVLTWMTCFCMATIDQYFATCTRLQWRRWNNNKVAWRISVIAIVFWILHNIPYIIFYHHVASASTGVITCSIIDQIFQWYANNVISLFVGRVLPSSIALLFGAMAYHNIQQIAHRTLPLVRRDLDKQLSVMVLVQVAVTFFTLVPYVIVYVLMSTPINSQNSLINAQLQFAWSTTQLVYYVNFSSPFYIYCCVSTRFRRQLKYVLFDIYFKRPQLRVVPAFELVNI